MSNFYDLFHKGSKVMCAYIFTHDQSRINPRITMYSKGTNHHELPLNRKQSLYLYEYCDYYMSSVTIAPRYLNALFILDYQ